MTTKYRTAVSSLEENLKSILPEEVDIAVGSLKRGKSAGVDNIPTELVQAAGRPCLMF